MSASKVAEETSLHVFGVLETLLRHSVVERDATREIPREGWVLKAAWWMHQGWLCEKLRLQDQFRRPPTDSPTLSTELQISNADSTTVSLSYSSSEVEHSHLLVAGLSDGSVCFYQSICEVKRFKARLSFIFPLR
jgi:hypothetical protein